MEKRANMPALRGYRTTTKWGCQVVLGAKAKREKPLHSSPLKGDDISKSYGKASLSWPLVSQIHFIYFLGHTF